MRRGWIGSSLILPHGFRSRQFSGFFNPEICRGTESHRVHSFVWPVATKSAEKFAKFYYDEKTGGSPRIFCFTAKKREKWRVDFSDGVPDFSWVI